MVAIVVQVFIFFEASSTVEAGGQSREDKTASETRPFVTLCFTVLFPGSIKSTMPGQVLGIKFRRGPTFRCVLSEALGMFLAVVLELEQHHLYLRTAPWKAACLIAPADDPETKARVLKELEAEWTMVVSLEAHPASAAELQQHCGFTVFQNYREVMTVCEKHGWKEHDEVASIMRSWFPEVAWSSNVESLFSEMSAAVKKSGQSDLGSVANLMSVGIRGLTRRICIQEDAPESLKLDKDDWSGHQVSGLKSKMFTPSSSPTCGSEQSMIRMQIVVVVVVGLVFPPFLSSFHFQAGTCLSTTS